MTTPDISSVNEELGSLEIYGIHFSTFTRSILMGLHELGLGKHFYHHKTPPHSKDVVAQNPFGLLPVLVHRPNALYSSADDTVVLYESNAIRRYIDVFLAPVASRKFDKLPQLTPPSPSHGVGGDSHTTMQQAVAIAHMDQWVSIASTILFPTVEPGVVKPRLAMESNKADEESIRVAIKDGVEHLEQRLGILEKDLVDRAGGKYLCGDAVTWADLFVYPPLADLRAVPEGSVLKGKDAKFPKLGAWLDRMDARDSAKATFEGTLASQRGA